MPQAKLRSALLPELREYLRARGVEIVPLAKEAGLPLDAAPDPTRPVPLDSIMHLFDLAASALNDPAFGIDFARSLKPGSTGLLGKLALTAPTLRDFVQSVGSYSSVFLLGCDVSYEEADGVGWLSWSFGEAVSAPRIQFNMFLHAVLIIRVRDFVRSDWVPLAVEVDHLPPDCPEAIRMLLGTRVRFHAPRNRIAYDAPTLARPLATADPMSFAILKDLGHRWIAEEEAHRPDTVAQVRAAISQMLPGGQPDLATVAAGLGLSPGALQWRLERENATFEAILSDERASRASRLLRDTDKSLTEIAFDLGFADPATFSRASRRWFGVPPRTYRQLLRHETRTGPALMASVHRGSGSSGRRNRAGRE